MLREIYLSHNVLILGNGFDLAMGRKTSYVNFLQFANSIFSNKVTSEYNNFDKWYKSTNFATRFNGILDLESNLIIDYITNVKLGQDPGWFEIENKISEIVSALVEVDANIEKYQDLFEKNHFILSDLANNLVSEFVPNYVAIRFVLEEVGNIHRKSEFNNLDAIQKANTRFELALDQITMLLELYLAYLDDSDFAPENISSPKQNALSGIDNIKNCDVINFNYTNTALKLFEIPLLKTHFIHGKIDVESENNNMVFGIEDKDSVSNTKVIAYQKYYQRILKETGNAFEHFIYRTNAPENLNVVIFGHSIGLLDKEIFIKCFDLAAQLESAKRATQLGSNWNYKFTFLYYDEKAKRSIIKNLVTILGKDKMVELTGLNKVEFVKSDDRKTLVSSLL